MGWEGGDAQLNRIIGSEVWVDLVVKWVASKTKQYATFIHRVIWDRVILKPARLVHWFSIEYLRELWVDSFCSSI